MPDNSHDGDQLNSNGINADDSLAEAEALFGKRSYYISGSGRFFYTPVIETSEFYLKALSDGLPGWVFNTTRFLGLTYCVSAAS